MEEVESKRRVLICDMTSKEEYLEMMGEVYDTIMKEAEDRINKETLDRINEETRLRYGIKEQPTISEEDDDWNKQEEYFRRQYAAMKAIDDENERESMSRRLHR